MGAVFGVIEARADGAPAVNIDFSHLGGAGQILDHAAAFVVVIPAEEIHAAGLHFRGDVGDDVELAKIGRAEIVEQGAAEILGIVVVEGAPAEAGVAVLAVVGQRNAARRSVARAHFPIAGIGPDGVDAGLLQIVEQRFDAFVEPGVRLDLYGDEVLAVADGPPVRLRRGLGLGGRAAGQESRTRGAQLEKRSTRQISGHYATSNSTAETGAGSAAAATQ